MTIIDRPAIKPITIIDLSEKSVFSTGKFPRLNKQSTLIEYRAQIIDQPHYPSEKVKIIEKVILSLDDYNLFAKNLLMNFNWLADKGGCDSDYQTELSGIDLLANEIELKKWQEQSYRLCILVVSDTHRRGILVDPQGYSYARYVGFPDNLPELTQEIDRLENNGLIIKSVALHFPKTTENERFVEVCFQDGEKVQIHPDGGSYYLTGHPSEKYVQAVLYLTDVYTPWVNGASLQVPR